MAHSSTPSFHLFPNRGFQITFQNGYTISVMFGSGNYCANENWGDDYATKSSEIMRCPNAEVAVIDPTGLLLPFKSSGDTVLGSISPNKVADIIAWASSQGIDNEHKVG